MSITHEERRTEPEKLYDKQVLERVKAGIALLEKEYGPDWVEHIDMKKLDLRDGAVCILGQVYANRKEGINGYWSGIEILGIRGNDGEYGFNIDNEFWEDFDEEEPDAEPRWAELQACWTDVLTPMVSRNNR